MENIGKCGFYCGSCPTFISGDCLGCIAGNKDGACYTRDCVLGKEINFCGECEDFPCDTIINTPKTTVLDKRWLEWKRKSFKDRN